MGRKAFSLIELTVALAAVAVLLSLVVPGVRWARERSLDTLTLSNLGQSVSACTAWSADHADRFVNGGGFAFPYLTVVTRGGEFVSQFDYLEHRSGWRDVLYASLGESHETWTSPRAPRSLFVYSNTAITDPAMWRSCESSNPQNAQYYRMVGQWEAEYPSLKILLTDVHNGLSKMPDAWRVGLVDGAAITLSSVDAAPSTFHQQCGSQVVMGRIPGVYTPDGIRGRDVLR